MVENFQTESGIPDEIKEFVEYYYTLGIPKKLIAIYSGLEVFDVISILKNKGLHNKDTRGS